MQVEGIVLSSMAVVLGHLDDNDDYKDYGAGWLTLETLREYSQSKEQVKIFEYPAENADRKSARPCGLKGTRALQKQVDRTPTALIPPCDRTYDFMEVGHGSLKRKRQ